MIDIDTLSNEATLTSFKSEIYIHERNRSTVSPMAIQRQEISTLSSAYPGDQDFVDGGRRRSDNSPYESVSEETQQFVISAVIDPKTKQKISLSQALAKGIINAEFGTYNNLETGEFMPIAKAMAMGLISVEFTNALSNGHLENGIMPQNSLETKSFAITGVIDPKTGETISVKEAISAGLIDLKNGK